MHNQKYKKKNKSLKKSWKSNIFEEILTKNLNGNLKIDRASINSREIKKNDVFFGLKGKNIDGNKFADHALKKALLLP